MYKLFLEYMKQHPDLSREDTNKSEDNLSDKSEHKTVTKIEPPPKTFSSSSSSSSSSTMSSSSSVTIPAVSNKINLDWFDPKCAHADDHHKE